MTNQVIPAEAVEAAAKAMFDTRDDPYDMDEWEEIDSTEREPYECQARAALEAAAPHMLAGLRADLVRLAKDFDTAEGGTLAYLSKNGLRKNAHDQLMYVMDDHDMLNNEGEK